MGFIRVPDQYGNLIIILKLKLYLDHWGTESFFKTSVSDVMAIDRYKLLKGMISHFVSVAAGKYFISISLNKKRIIITKLVWKYNNNFLLFIEYFFIFQNFFIFLVLFWIYLIFLNFFL